MAAIRLLKQLEMNKEIASAEQQKGREILKRIRNGTYKVAINDDIESGRIVL